MYCRNCGNEVAKDAIACTKCGVPPMKGKYYCFNCGAVTHEDAIMCVSCGIALNSTLKLNTTNAIASWGKWAYSNYVLILLLSLLPFVNIQSNNEFSLFPSK